MKMSIPFEDETQEFKTSLSQLDAGIDSLAAMLNKHRRGTVYFGVANDGEILGLEGELGEETLKKIGTRVEEQLKPITAPEVACQYFGDKTIIKVSVRGNNRPYASRGNYLIRIGSQNKKIDPDLLGELFYSSQSSSLETLESLNQHLSFNELKQMYTNAGFTVNEGNFDENMHFLTKGKYNYLANLLADENDISIKVVRFEGKDKLKMVSRNEFGFKCLFLAMKQALNFTLSLNETRVDIESALERKETPLFDRHAFEEAWTNACVHNKWIRNVPPAVYIFSDRIEVVSAGGLPFDYSADEFYRGVSNPVNPELARIMLQLGLVEQTGHGNLLIISKYGKEAFALGENYIGVTIPFAFVPTMALANQPGLLPSQKQVFEALANHPTHSLKAVSSLVGLGTTRVSQIVDELKTMGILERVGGRKGGYWRVKGRKDD